MSYSSHRWRPGRREFGGGSSDPGGWWGIIGTFILGLLLYGWSQIGSGTIHTMPLQ